MARAARSQCTSALQAGHRALNRLLTSTLYSVHVATVFSFPLLLMKKFSIGTLAGVSSLVLIPLLASAASSASGTAPNPPSERPALSQECVQALVAKNDLMLSTFDETSAARKAAMLSHRAALAAAASITDEAQRQEALQQAHEDFRAAMQGLRPANADQMEAAREAVHEACGGAIGPMGGMGRGKGNGVGGGRMMGGAFGDGTHFRQGFEGQVRGGQRGCPFGAGAVGE